MAGHVIGSTPYSSPPGTGAQNWQVTRTVTAGNLVILAGYSWKSGNSSPPGASAVTDSHGNTWFRIDTWGSGTPKAWQYAAQMVSSGSVTITLNFGSTAWHGGMAAIEMPPPVGGGSALDKQAGSDNTGDTTTPTMPSMTPAQADSVFVGVCCARAGAYSSIAEPSLTTAAQESVGTDQDGQVAYLALNATSAIAPQWTVAPSQTHTLYGVVYKTGAASSGPEEFFITPGGSIGAAGGTRFAGGKALAGVTAPAATLTRAGSRRMTGSSAPASDLQLLASRAFEGTLAAESVLGFATMREVEGAVALLGLLETLSSKTQLLEGEIGLSATLETTSVKTQLLEGVVDFATTLRRDLSGAYRGSVAVEGATQAAILTRMAGAVDLDGRLVRHSSMVFTSALTPESAVTIFKALLQTYEGTLGTAGDLRVDSARRFLGALGLSGSVARSVMIAPAGVLLFSSRLARASSVSMTGAVAPAGTVEMLKALLVTWTGSVSLSGDIVHRASLRSFLGVAGAAGRLAVDLATRVQGTLALSGHLAKQSAHALSGQTAPAGSLIVASFTTLLLTGVVSAAGSVALVSMLTLRGTVSLAGSVARTISVRLRGVLALSGRLSKAISRTWRGIVGLVGSLLANLGSANRSAITVPMSMTSEIIVPMASSDTLVVSMEAATELAAPLEYEE